MKLETPEPALATDAVLNRIDSVKRDAVASVKTLRDKIHAENCTACHLKFRWDTHSDITDLKNLRGKQSD